VSDIKPALSPARDFTIEWVDIVPIDKADYPPGEAPPFDHRMVLFARMNYGEHAFINEQWITDETLRDVGRDVLIAGMKASAHKPTEPPPPLHIV
jgi:hypothetical protein